MDPKTNDQPASAPPAGTPGDVPAAAGGMADGNAGVPVSSTTPSEPAVSPSSPVTGAAGSEGAATTTPTSPAPLSGGGAMPEEKKDEDGGGASPAA